MSPFKKILQTETNLREQLVKYKSALHTKNNKDLSQDIRLVSLEYDLSKMQLAVMGLTRILTDKGIFSADEFSEVLDILDEEDGTKDGRVTPPESANWSPFVVRDDDF